MQTQAETDLKLLNLASVETISDLGNRLSTAEDEFRRFSGRVGREIKAAQKIIEEFEKSSDLETQVTGARLFSRAEVACYMKKIIEPLS